MVTVLQSVRASGGLAATFELHSAGHTRAAITAAMRSGRVIRVRQGWYGPSDLHPALLRAARVGGRLTCLSALSLQGLWTYPTNLLHVAVPDNGCRLRTPHDMRTRLGPRASVRVHWRTDTSSTRLMLPPLACLTDLIDCEPPEVVVASADSLLRQHPHLRPLWGDWADARPARERGWLDRVDGICESGTESLVWFRMRPYRLPMRRQVRVRGVGRVDFLVGERLVIEVDGAAYHTDPERFETDRHRDAVLSRLGYRVLRFSYRQVIHSWREVESAILAAVIRGDHH